MFWACNVSARTAQVRAVGGFDEAFRSWGGEDRGLPRCADQVARRERAAPDLVPHYPLQQYAAHLASGGGRPPGAS